MMAIPMTNRSITMKDTQRFLLDRLAYSFVVAAARLPLSGSYKIADALASLLPRICPILRNPMHNLRIAFGDERDEWELERIARESFRNLFRTAMEIVILPRMNSRAIAESVELDGAEHLDNALEAGNGVIFVTAHYGNWELMGARLIQAGYKGNVVVKDHRNPRIAALLNGIRTQVGMDVIDRTDSRGMLRSLNRNELLGILVDQNAKDGGILVDFFGRPASTVTGPAVLARRTKAAVIPAFIERGEGLRHRITVHPPLQMVRTDDKDHDIRINTALITKQIEVQIRKRPEEWMWAHRRWRLPEQLECADQSVQSMSCPDTEFAVPTHPSVLIQ